MENKWFTKAGSLVDEAIKTNNTFLKPAGPLEEPLKINNTFLKPAGSLEEPIEANETFINSNQTFFKPAGDLENSSKNNSFRFEEIEMDFKSPEEIRALLKTIVSGDKKANYAFEEGLQATSAGHKFVSIEELQQMVKNGDNIIKAEYFDNMNMVMVEFESFKMPSKSR